MLTGDREIAFARVTEELKQRMDANKRFDPDKAFNSVDDWNYGFIDRRNLKAFLKKHGYLAKNEEVVAIIRRMDLDADARLSRQEFISAITPDAPYSKLLKQRSTSRRKSSRIPSFSNTRVAISDISKFRYRPDEMLKLSAKQRDPIRARAMDRR